MNHYIFCLMGKSASGKDTIYQKIRKLTELTGNPPLKEVVPYTTRPIREGERNGETYYFETDEQFESAKAAGRIIEFRNYDTVAGVWHYYTKDDGQINLKTDSYLIIGTLESFLSFREYFGEESVIPLYVEVDDGERLQRALNRERQQRHPAYAEMCRRFLADERDFSRENLKRAGVRRRFRNDEIDPCVREILAVIEEKLQADSRQENGSGMEQSGGKGLIRT